MDDVTQAPAQAEQTTEGNGKVDSVSPSAPLQVELGQLGEVFGTKFDSPDKALESIRNLNKLVGDQTIAEQRKAYDKFKKIESALAPEATAQGFTDTNQYLDYLLEQNGGNQAKPEEWRTQKQENQKESELYGRLTKTEEELSHMKFEKQFGSEAVKYYDAHKAWVQSQGLKDEYRAWERSPFKELVEADRNKGATSVIENSRVSEGSAKDYERDLAEAQRTKNWMPFLEKHKGFEGTK